MKTEEIQPSRLLKELWDEFGFSPDENQQRAILHLNGPLYLPAAPGSGKTRVLLWRTVNLIITHAVALDEIYLSTFTEKAAKQLRDGLRTYLTAASLKTGVPYDLSKLYVGTVHSLCQRLLADRRLFAPGHHRSRPILLDELGQYLFIRRKTSWERLISFSGDDEVTNTKINAIFGDKGRSRHKAISNLISFFNRLSEEMVDPNKVLKDIIDPNLRILVGLYKKYLELLKGYGGPTYTDLSLIQKITLDFLENDSRSTTMFKHVIIDEYQDTNSVQEALFFRLAKGYSNFCVVGDDDQALYRFRGATVENFVNFEERCKKALKIIPKRIDLTINYRSCDKIVSYSGEFINHSSCNWKKDDSDGAYRVMDKVIRHKRECHGIDVVYSSPNSPERVASEIALLVMNIIDAKKVTDPNQIAFLFPSLKSKQVARMKKALEDKGLRVYAPRAGTFLYVKESMEILGTMLLLFDDVDHRHTGFKQWIVGALQKGKELTEADSQLKNFIELRKNEMNLAKKDYVALSNTLQEQNWAEAAAYDPDTMQSILASTSGISPRCQKSINSEYFRSVSSRRLNNGIPFTLKYVITRAASVDWNFLDLYYQLCGFSHFKKYFDYAEESVDEGPISNLSLISKYISRYNDEYPGIISGRKIERDLPKISFLNFLYVLYRREESEYEDDEDSFPKGRIPFITIHQAKGLEFPVVVMANPRKNIKKLTMENILQQILPKNGEPLNRMPLYDLMRMFYVGITRAKNLLVIPHFDGKGQTMGKPFEDLMQGRLTISQLDISSLPASDLYDDEVPQSYSYTADFLLYKSCPRQYMIFREYNFAPSRTQTMFFGSLVHQTLDDLHQILIRRKKVDG